MVGSRWPRVRQMSSSSPVALPRVLSSMSAGNRCFPKNCLRFPKVRLIDSTSIRPMQVVTEVIGVRCRERCRWSAVREAPKAVYEQAGLGGGARNPGTPPPTARTV